MATTKKTTEKAAAKKAPAKKAPVKKTTAKKAAPKKVEVPQHIGLVRDDGWLEPFEQAIRGRHDHALWKIGQLTRNGKTTLSQFASGHLYFGLHKLAKGWVFREWAPNATEIYLIGDFNNWQEDEKYKCKRIEGTGNWELKLSEKALKHGQLYKMKVKWNGGEGERIPAWCRRVVQDDQTKIFSAQVWNPEKPYEWKKKTFKPNKSPLLIYECHVGMGQDAEKVGTYKEFTQNVLPRVKKDGYNAIQVMAIQEHPYYGSFGYHVSSFFAPSSRFGTPEDLKEMIDPLHDFEDVKVFEGCMPIEIMAARGVNTLRFGPLKPTGLDDPKTGRWPYACLQLRKENEDGTLFNMVGFQTNLKWGEQKRVFGIIPALKNAEYVRYGVMHKNSFINSPEVINADFSLKTDGKIYFAGQITGVEGYVESVMSGLFAAINCERKLSGKEIKIIGEETVSGALIKYITTKNADFQPMNANFGIMPKGEIIRDKSLRKRKIAERSLETAKRFSEEIL